MGSSPVMHSERYLLANHAGTGGPAFDFSLQNDDGLYNDGTVDVQTADWSAFATEQVVEDGQLVAQYVIEYIGPATATGGSLAAGTGGTGSVRYLYRVTGRGDSPGGSVRLVQTIFATE